MAKRIGGMRRKTRHKLKKKARVSLSRNFQDFKIGERVALSMNPSVHKAAYFPRFHGKIGMVKGRKGKNFEIMIKDKGKNKTMVINPTHLKRV